MNKFGMLAIMWVGIIFAYVILAFSMPVLISITANTTATMAASANMSNFPGTSEGITLFPLLAWFIPGAVGVAATVVALRS